MEGLEVGAGLGLNENFLKTGESWVGLGSFLPGGEDMYQTTPSKEVASSLERGGQTLEEREPGGG